jgi:hypothetical protein
MRDLHFAFVSVLLRRENALWVLVSVPDTLF